MTALAMEAAPRERIGLASGVQNAARQAGGALGVALLGTFLTAGGGLSLHLPLAVVCAAYLLALGLTLVGRGGAPGCARRRADRRGQLATAALRTAHPWADHRWSSLTARIYPARRHRRGPGSPASPRQRGDGDPGWLDLVAIEGRDELGVDEARVDADDLGALPLQLDPRGVGVGPGGGLRRRVGGEDRGGEPGQHREHVDHGAAAVGGEGRGEGLGGRDQREVVDLELGAGVVEARRERRRRESGARVVDEQVDVGQLGGDRVHPSCAVHRDATALVVISFGRPRRPSRAALLSPSTRS